jgi:exodeoxyribonuclease-3
VHRDRPKARKPVRADPFVSGDVGGHLEPEVIVNPVDVACLQELKALDGMFPHQALREAGYSSVWKGQRSWNGVAILARGTEPLEVRRELPGDPTDDHSRYLEAAVGGVLVACLYLPNGNPRPGPKFNYKLAWFERFIEHAAGLYDSGQPVVMAGDYNVVPTDFDIYNPRSWLKDALLQPESRECYQRLLKQGWIDAIRHLHPDEAIFTFWDYFRKHWDRDAGLRIDHLLLNATLAPCLVQAGVDRWVRGQEHASDHAPTWVELDLSKLGKKPAGRRKAS